AGGGAGAAARRRARGLGASGARPSVRPAARPNRLWRATTGRDRDGPGAGPESATARRALRRPLERRAAGRAAIAGGDPARGDHRHDPAPHGSGARFLPAPPRLSILSSPAPTP